MHTATTTNMIINTKSNKSVENIMNTITNMTTNTKSTVRW